jgi:hypothetical protein
MPINFKSPKAKRWIIAGIALASLVAYCAPPGTFRGIDFEFTGTVRDKETNEPLEGAYVVAIYYVREGDFAVSAVKCKKTKGMYTGKDGKFHFPIEKLNNLSPGDITAIRPGYYGNHRVIPSAKLQDAQTAETYSNRDFYLVKQNPDKPEFRYGDMEEGCLHAEYREDVEASIEFKKIILAEAKRLGAHPLRVENFNRGIAYLEALPTNPKKR